MKILHSYRLSLLLLCTVIIVSGCSKNKQSITPQEEGYKTINGTEIYYKKVGVGEPIIIVHGGPVLDHGYLAPYFKPLSKNFELVYYDQRLSGRSSADTDSSEVRLKTFVEDIEALRKTLGLRKIHLIAHSWGGLLAMNYAIAYPAQLQSLILMNSIPGSSDLWNKEQKLLAQKVTDQDRNARSEILNSDLFKNDQPKAIEKLLKASFRSEFYDPSLADSLNLYIPDDYMSRSKKFGYLGPDISSYDLHPELSKLNVPTLLMYGETEPAAKLSGTRLDSTLQNSSLKIIPKAGHFPFIERNDMVIEELRNFLTKNR